MFTNVMENDCTKDQIMSAKKTVQVITEVNGHRYISEFEGTGVVALTHQDDGGGCCVKGYTVCDSHAMMHFISALFDQLTDKDRLLLMFKLTLKLENQEAM